jgi:hypothetical protein
MEEQGDDLFLLVAIAAGDGHPLLVLASLRARKPPVAKTCPALMDARKRLRKPSRLAFAHTVIFLFNSKFTGSFQCLEMVSAGVSMRERLPLRPDPRSRGYLLKFKKRVKQAPPNICGVAVGYDCFGTQPQAERAIRVHVAFGT